jgi:hypothetical protein
VVSPPWALDLSPMKTVGVWRVVSVFVAAIALGAVYSVLRGNASGVHDLLSNVSAPWLALPLLSGWFAFGDRPWRGALIGVLVTAGALAAFDLTGSFVLGLGPHRTIAEAFRTLLEDSALLRIGTLSGAVFGALGSWLGTTRSTVVASVCAGLFMLEPFAWIATALWRDVPISVNARYYPIGGAEAASGLALAAIVWRRRTHSGLRRG